MIELFGKSFCFNRDTLKAALARIINGDELTINYHTKEAWINKWHDNPVKIDFDVAYVWYLSGLVGDDSGNFETNECHYTFKMR